MRKKNVKKLLGIAMALTLITALGGTAVTAYARGGFGQQGGFFGGATTEGNAQGSFGLGTQNGGTNGLSGMSGFGGMGGFGNMMGNVELASEPSEIVTSTLTCTAAQLKADTESAVTYVMSEENNSVKITEAGTYVVTGTCSDGNIVVKKDVTGVVLILKDLDLTSTTGATVSCNKGSEVQIIVQGTVRLTDAEDPADEDSADAETADAFDGAAIKVKDGANVYLTGTGTLTIDASSCKNGIKAGDGEGTCLVIDDLTLNITAANDAINAGYDLTILGGSVSIWAGDDAIHADRILTIGSSDGNGPTINVYKSYEGFEGTVVNLFGGNAVINSSDDAVNAANSDGTYVSEMAYSINITGGNYTIKSQGDGLDSNGNINITGGYVTISSASNGGEAGIDYDGTCYIADGTVNNSSGISGSDMMPGQMGGGMNDQQGQMPGQVGGGMNGQQGQMPGQVGGGMNGQQGQMPGQMGGGMNGQQGQMPDQMGGGMNDQQGQMPVQMPGRQGNMRR